MLKTSESQSQPVLVLFYAALFLLFHTNTAWSQVTKVTVYEQTSGPANWSQHHRGESEVLSEWERIQSDTGIAHLTARGTLSPLSTPYCPRSSRIVVLVKPNLAWSRSSSGSLPCHKRQRFITSPLLPSCIFFPSTLFFLFLSPKVCLYWRPPAALKHFSL